MANKRMMLAGVAFLLLTAPALGEPPASRLTDSREVVALTEAVNRLATVLEARQHADEGKPSLEKLNLAISYLDFRSRRIEQLERDIAATKTARNTLETNLRANEDRVRQLGERQNKTLGTMTSDTEREADQLKTNSSRIRERIRLLDDEVVQQENRIYELKKEILSVEDYVRRNLAF